MPALAPGRDGRALLELVRAYAELGDHRTGTATDAETREWFAALAARELDVDLDRYTFDRFDAVTALTADGAPVAHLPLFYESTATVGGAVPALTSVDVVANWAAPDLPERIRAAAEGGAAALVVGTGGDGHRLVAFNRTPVPGSGLPVVLVAGADLARLRAAEDVRLDHAARIVPATSDDVVARAGSSGPEVIVTTSLTGWFSCAGERGGGVALALDLAERLARRARVTLLATTGHELDHAGARHWLEGAGVAVRPDAVLHLGASIATGPAVEGHAGELVQSHLLSATEAAVADAYAGGAATFVGAPERWVSEGKEWVRRTDHLLSFTGSFPLFHTPDDRVDAALTAERLDDATRRLDRAAGLILASAGSGHRPRPAP